MKRTVEGTRGFTLMEIMTVIIVIAVLASVGGPVLTGIVDKGRDAACRRQFNALNKAIRQHQIDVGFYPFIGGYEPTTNAELLSDDSSNNALVSDSAATSIQGFQYNINDPVKYKKKWKGPYMDSDAEQFMIDPWGRRIRVTFHYRKAFLHSAGPDGDFDNYWDANIDAPSDLATPAYSGDDVVMLVASTLDKPP